jgi:hypothetical protein
MGFLPTRAVLSLAALREQVGSRQRSGGGADVETAANKPLTRLAP